MNIVPSSELSRLSVIVQEAKAITPRNRHPEAVVRAVLEQAMLDLKFAVGCIYAVPRAGKVIRGPSVRLAEILRYVWGGIWIEAVDVVEHHDHIIAKVIGVDTVNGNLTCEIVPERIVDRTGRRYDLDGILNAKRAALAKAKRNVILDLIPASLVSNRVVVALRAKLAAKRAEIEQEYKEAIAELAARFKKTEQILQMDLAKRLGVNIYEDEHNGILSTDFMLTIVEYANAIQELDISMESVDDVRADREKQLINATSSDIGEEHTLQVTQMESHNEDEATLHERDKRVRPIRK